MAQAATFLIRISRPLHVSALSLVCILLMEFRLPAAEIPQVQLIDAAIEQQWNDYSLKPSPVEDDLKWGRRVFLDLIGRIPSYQESLEFEKDRSSDKRQKLVDRLLNDSRYTEEFATHWANVWSNILIGRSGGTQRNSFTSREGLAKYLRDSFANNKSYDRMVYELITATGTSKPGTSNFNGAVNFLADKVNAENGTLATSATAKIFLGMQVQCTQCHNHPFNQWKQQKFWEFNAFFRQTRSLRRFVEGTNDIDFVELIDQDFEGESRRPREADLFYEERNGLTKVAFPVFIDGTAIERSGYVGEVNRREQLGKLVLQSEFLPKMIVNRMWAHFLGYGFTKPIDDLGPHNTVSHPQLLDVLSAEFVKASYNQRELMRWIVLSKPYQLSSVITKDNEADDPSMGELPQFSHFYLRQMTAEQLYQSLIAAGGTAKGSLEQQQQDRDRWLSQFVVAFGTDEGDEATSFNGSIPQALMMFNGELVKRAIDTTSGSPLGALAKSNAKYPEKVQGLFLLGLSRKPKADEIKIANGLLQARQGKVEDALQDLWWAILNSNEFIFVQ